MHPWSGTPLLCLPRPLFCTFSQEVHPHMTYMMLFDDWLLNSIQKLKLTGEQPADDPGAILKVLLYLGCETWTAYCVNRAGVIAQL